MATGDVQLVGSNPNPPPTTAQDQATLQQSAAFQAFLRGSGSLVGGAISGVLGGGSLQLASLIGRALTGASGATGDPTIDNMAAMQQQLLDKQMAINSISEQFTAQTNIMQAQHETAMSVIRNMKGS